VKAGASAGTGGVGWTDGVITDLRATIVSAGGILPVHNNAGEPGAYPGQYQDNDNAHYLQRWNGTDWVAYPKEIGGIAPTGTLSTGSYAGQYRDANGVLQRWNGTTFVTYQPPVEVENLTTGATALANWSVTYFYARRTRGMAMFNVNVTRTGADITANSTGNITDEPLCTLPIGWRPPINLEAVASDGVGHGAAVVHNTGDITLRTWSPGGLVTASRPIRITATFVQ
jgi:hypothetical protein